MKKMSKSTKNQETGKIALRTLLAFLIVSLSGCAGLAPFPTSTLWEFDRVDQVCGEYKIVQHDPRLRFQHVRDVPLAQCPAIFGFTSADIPKVLDWSEDAVKFSKERCR